MRRVNHAALRDLIAAIVAVYDPAVAVIEEVGGWGIQSGQFAFGYTTGALHQAIAAADVPIVGVGPKEWKAALGIVSPKKSSYRERKAQARVAASELFPEFPHLWPRVGHHDRAEAALLALYGYRKLEASRHEHSSLPLSSRRGALAR